jgi:hypothetical protein
LEAFYDLETSDRCITVILSYYKPLNTEKNRVATSCSIARHLSKKSRDSKQAMHIDSTFYTQRNKCLSLLLNHKVIEPVELITILAVPIPF